MPSDEFYYDLCYKLSRLVDNVQIVTNAIMVILSFLGGLYFDIFASMYIFWLIF